MAIPVISMHPSTTSTNFTQQQQQTPYHHHQHHHQNIHSAHTRRRSPSPVSRRSEASHRARSLSPLHVGIDPKTY
jgi:hypothetical protein